MKYAYISKNFSRASQELIDNANRVIAQYAQMGYVMTLRQLYYQMVIENLIPNKIKEYRRLANILNDARWAGLVDWDAIEDRVRETVQVSTWSSPKSIMRSAWQSYREDWWERQPDHIEIFCEKDAVSNIIEPICREYRVPFTANRGYPSVSLLRETSVRLAEKAGDGKNIFLIYVGDFDPSGLDMDRDIEERLRMFTEGEYFFNFRRIALIEDQVDQWSLPPNPAKQTDSRFEAFMERYGDESWELDAIRANDLADLIREAIAEHIDYDLWDDAQADETKNREKLQNLMGQL